MNKWYIHTKKWCRLVFTMSLFTTSSITKYCTFSHRQSRWWVMEGWQRNVSSINQLTNQPNMHTNKKANKNENKTNQPTVTPTTNTVIKSSEIKPRPAHTWRLCCCVVQHAIERRGPSAGLGPTSLALLARFNRRDFFLPAKSKWMQGSYRLHCLNKQ